MAARRPAQWPPRGRLRDERLAFLAAQPEIERRATNLRARIGRAFNRLGRPITWATAHARTRRPDAPAPPRKHGPLSSALMRHYVLAVDVVAGRLSEPERVALRRSGDLPDWFFPAVEEERRRLQQEWREPA